MNMFFQIGIAGFFGYIPKSGIAVIFRWIINVNLQD